MHGIIKVHIAHIIISLKYKVQNSSDYIVIQITYI